MTIHSKHLRAKHLRAKHLRAKHLRAKHLSAKHLWAAFALTVLLGCGGNAADRAGIGSTCTANADCFQEGQTCLTNFKGGYCGSTNCVGDADCPVGAGCVRHEDGVNYCFRVCAEKPECNANRGAANESNCVGSADFVDAAHGPGKACIPPSSGI